MIKYIFIHQTAFLLWFLFIFLHWLLFIFLLLLLIILHLIIWLLFLFHYLFWLLIIFYYIFWLLFIYHLNFHHFGWILFNFVLLAQKEKYNVFIFLGFLLSQLINCFWQVQSTVFRFQQFLLICL